MHISTKGHTLHTRHLPFPLPATQFHRFGEPLQKPAIVVAARKSNHYRDRVVAERERATETSNGGSYGSGSSSSSGGSKNSASSRKDGQDREHRRKDSQEHRRKESQDREHRTGNTAIALQRLLLNSQSLPQLNSSLAASGHLLDASSLAAALSQLPKLHAAAPGPNGMR